MPSLPAELKPEQICAVIDTREQQPLDLSPLQTTTETLVTGDYSVVGLESVIAIERKSLEDLLGCIGRDRERFEKEIQRLMAYPTRALVIESGWQALERGEWNSGVKPAAAVGSLLAWIAAGLPVVMTYDHERAGRFVSRMLFLAARRRYRENRAICSLCTDEPK